LEIKAKKKFGQNFLKDSTILSRIIQSMPNSDRVVVEIGPGLGDLTAKLLHQKRVAAFEVDNDLCKILKEVFELELDKKELELICGDVLDSWDDTLLDIEYDLIANLPYYISTNIILRALEDKNCKNIMVMVQKEVAQKFSAVPNSKEYSSLGIITAFVGDAKILFDVPPSAFEPQPKVTSSILLIKKRDNAFWDDDFNRFLKYAFSQPRKKLIKNLSSSYNITTLKLSFSKLELDENLRPHQLDAKSYHHLYKLLNSRVCNGREETK
jgi:16S rRNA (adenine1518-N6/adenine1519-N6)-dimethyltransferase